MIEIQSTCTSYEDPLKAIYHTGYQMLCITVGNVSYKIYYLTEVLDVNLSLSTLKQLVVLSKRQNI